MSLSPRAQVVLEKLAMASADEFFEEGFREMALHRVMSEMPELSEQIVAFKILHTDMDSDTAVGSLIVDRGSEEVHVPVILTENTLAPFDIMYVKSIDQYLPLTEDWLIELDRMDASSMGHAVDTPENLRSDQDIRNVVVPPTTGRYSYASARKTLLPTYLAEAHNMVKQSFLKTMEKHPKIAKYVFEHYDHSDLKDAMRPHVEKKAEISSKINFVTIETPVSETRELYGEDTPRAAREIAEKGYSAKDDREQTNRVITEEEPLTLQVPDSAGFYRVFLADGTSPNAMIFPKVLTAEGMYKQRTLGAGRSNDSFDLCGKDPYETDSRHMRMVYTDDGRFIVTKNDFVAQPIQISEASDRLKNIVTQKNPRTPRNGQRGFFCDPDAKNMTAMEPVKIEFVTTKEGTRHIKGYTYNGDYVQIVQIKDSPVRKPRSLSGRNRNMSSEWVSYDFQTKEERKQNRHYDSAAEVILVPWDYKFIPVTEIVEPRDLIRDADAVTAMFYNALVDSGAQRIRLKNAGMGQVYFDGDMLSPFETVKKLACVYGVNVPDAEHAVKVASTTYDASNFYVVTPQVESRFLTRVKKAYGMPPEEGMYPDEAMMDPAMMDPAMMMMMPPEPPPPSPVELAAQEIAEQVMQSGNEVINQLIQQQQSLETQMGVIQAVMNRASQIEAEQMGYDAGPPVGAPPVEPPPPPAAGDPAAEMGAPTPGAGAPMGPEAGMGAPMGPEAGMPIEEPMAMEEAMGLADPELFDAAAIASIAEQNEFDASIAHFIPIFQEALDGLGRTLMELRVKGSQLKEEMGESSYSEILDNAETLFERLGNMVIRLDEVSAAVPSE